MDCALVWSFVSVGGKPGPATVARMGMWAEVTVTLPTICYRTGAKTKLDLTRLPSAPQELQIETFFWGHQFISVSVTCCRSVVFLNFLICGVVEWDLLFFKH